MSRALRRHHEFRLKQAIAKRVNKIKQLRGSKEREIGKLFHSPTICSCPSCGNPRKWFGEKTIQEQKVDQEYS